MNDEQRRYYEAVFVKDRKLEKAKAVAKMNGCELVDYETFRQHKKEENITEYIGIMFVAFVYFIMGLLIGLSYIGVLQ